MHLTQKGQVTIPKKFREKYGFYPKTGIIFKEEGGHLILTKIDRPLDPLDHLVGILGKPQSSDSMIRRLRG
jgi:bifunctional DNA-binding transcriptional regulator/antitoxin component of YhaV-PrlF toxin-antitoxin module